MRTHDVPIIDISGTPKERGIAHGEALRAKIAEKIDIWFQVINDIYRQPPAGFIRRLTTETVFKATILNFCPDLLDEVSGIAIGSGQPDELIYAMQLMDEEWWFAEEAHDHCSSVAILPTCAGEPARVGQTQDLPRWFDGTQSILRFRDEHGGPTAIITSAGMIGLMGANGHGLAVCMNSLRRLANSRHGLPVAFCVRMLLRSRTYREAVDWAIMAPHATAQSYLVCDRTDASAIECSAGRKVVARSREVPSRVFHTNHAFENDETIGGGNPHSLKDSHVRLDSLRRQLGGLVPEVGLEDIKAALASRDDPKHPISKAPSLDTPMVTSRTFAGVIYELGNKVTVNFCGGPPSVEPWTSFSLDQIVP